MCVTVSLSLVVTLGIESIISALLAVVLGSGNPANGTAW